jgi:hypothetical protein
MQWARDVVGELRIGIRSAKSLLTVMTRVMVGGMDAVPIVVRDSTTSSDGIAGIATVTSTDSVAEIDFGIVIGMTDGGGADRHS